MILRQATIATELSQLRAWATGRIDNTGAKAEALAPPPLSDESPPPAEPSLLQQVFNVFQNIVTTEPSSSPTPAPTTSPTPDPDGIFDNLTVHHNTTLGTDSSDTLVSNATTTLNANTTVNADLSINGGLTATTLSGSGAGLTSLNASALATGTVADARLSANVALLDATNHFRPVTDSTGALRVQNAAGSTTVLAVDTTNARVGIGTAAPAYLLDVAGDLNATNLRLGGSLMCTSGGCLPASGSTYYVQNQFGTDQSADFRISGTGRIGSALQAPLLDTATATTLAVGSTNATAINLDQNVTIASGKSFTAGGTALFRNSANSTTAFQVQNAAGTAFLTLDSTNQHLTVKDTTINGTLALNGHLITGNSSGTTTVAAGSAAGSGGSASLSGNDTAGTITVNTGIGVLSTGTLVTVSFANAYTAAPRVVYSPASSTAANLQDYISNVSTSGFTINLSAVAIISTTYIFNYYVAQ